MHRMSIVALLLLVAVALAGTCVPPSTITSSDSLSSIFDEAATTVQYQNTIFDYLADPTSDNLRIYITTQGRFFIPIWCAAGVTFFLLMACCLQLCCFSCCARQSCGTKISRKSFRPCIVGCCVYSFIFFSFVLLGFVIATFILTSDLIKQTEYTICHADETLNQLFDGTDPGVTPSWSGADSFYSTAQQISTNFQNTLPDATTKFTSTEYQAVSDSTAGSAYSASVSYNCPSALTTTTVNCPFANFFECSGGSASQLPIYSEEFCNSSFEGSASFLILNEQEQNSTSWHDSLVSQNTEILSFGATPADFSTLLSESQQLQSAITDYKPQLRDSITMANDNIYYSEVGIYTLLSLFTLMAVLSFLSIFILYWAKRFACRYMLSAIWVLSGLLATLLFLGSGVLMIGALTAYDGCTAYFQITTVQDTLTSLPSYSSSQFVQTLEACFFAAGSGSDTVFEVFSQSSTFSRLKNIQTQYSSSLPSSSFNSVSENILEQLSSFTVNPNTVELSNSTSAQNPQAALDNANLFAANGGSQSCSAVDDRFAFNPIGCFPLLLNQPAGDPSCILISSASAPVVAARQTNFIANNCSGNFPVYESNFNALNTFGQDISNLNAQYTSDSSLNSYKVSYQNYYSTVNAFMNNETRSMFESYLLPFAKLIDGSQCSFLTKSLDTLVATACNNNFPYIYVITTMSICMGVCFFFLMVLAYFLTTRMEFYEYLEGDFDNYDEYAKSSDTLAIEMADMSYRNQRLIESPNQTRASPNDARHSPSNEARYQNQPDNVAMNHQRYDGQFDPEDPRYQRFKEGTNNRYNDFPANSPLPADRTINNSRK